MRPNRPKSPAQQPDADPPDIPADRWQRTPTRTRKGSALLPVVIVLIGIGIVGGTAYATATLFNLHPVHLISSLFHRTPASPAPDQPANAATTTQASNVDAPTARPASRFSRPFALWRTMTYSLTDAAPDQPQPFHEAIQIVGDVQYLDGGTFQTVSALIKISGISSLPREAVCIGSDRAKFACGLMARASLSLLFSPERPRCYPDVSLATPEPAWMCTSRGRLLSMAQIEAGFALPSQPSIQSYVDLAAKARTARVGAWNGDWTVATPATGSP